MTQLHVNAIRLCANDVDVDDDHLYVKNYFQYWNNNDKARNVMSGVKSQKAGD